MSPTNTSSAPADAPVYYGYPNADQLDDEQVRALLTQWAGRPGAPQFYADALRAIIKIEEHSSLPVTDQPVLPVRRTAGVFSVVEDSDSPGTVRLCEYELLDIISYWDDRNDILTVQEACAVGFAAFAKSSDHCIEDLRYLLSAREHGRDDEYLSIIAQDPDGYDEPWDVFKIDNRTAAGVADAFWRNAADLKRAIRILDEQRSERERDEWLETEHKNAAAAMEGFYGECALDGAANEPRWSLIDVQHPDGKAAFGVIQEGDDTRTLHGVTADRTGRAIESEIEDIAEASCRKRRIAEFTPTPASVEAPRRPRP